MFILYPEKATSYLKSPFVSSSFGEYTDLIWILKPDEVDTLEDSGFGKILIIEKK